MCSKEAIFLISKLTVSVARHMRLVNASSHETDHDGLSTCGQEIATGKIMSQSQQTARLQKRAKTVKYDDLGQ